MSKPLTTYWMLPGIRVPSRPIIARQRVRYIGEPIVALAAEDPYLAVDARDAIEVDFEPLRAVVDAESALASGSPRVHEEFSDNITYHLPMRGGDADKALAQAHLVINKRFRVQRLAASAMETRVVLAMFDRAAGDLTLYSSTQWPHILRTVLAPTLGLPENKVRVIAPDVGGGFGPKGEIYVEEVAISLLSMLTGRPVKWVETRQESYLATTHSRDQVISLKSGFRKDGTILGLKVRLLCDFGAYLQALTAGTPFITALSLNGPYHIHDYAVDVVGIFTNKVPSSAYRGFGQCEAAFAIERCMDIAADELGIDPAELRFRNLIQSHEFPYQTMTGGIYDSGDYPRCLQKALDLAGYDEVLSEQRRRRAAGGAMGIGMAIFGETTGFAPSHVFSKMGLQLGGYDSAIVRMNPDGRATVLVGTSPHGQGLDTTLAQVVADELGLSYTDVTVLHGDTAVAPYGQGTFGSRSIVVSSSAAVSACRRLREKLLSIAASLLEARKDELETAYGEVVVREAPDRRIAIREVAHAAYLAHNLPEGVEPGLEVTSYYDPAGLPTSYAAHLAVVSLDLETGKLQLEKYVVVHDCGTVINPQIVEGQIHGAVVQGIGQAILEEIVYDGDGHLMSNSFTDYLLPTAMDVPDIEVEHQQTPTPLNPLGVKGMGEGGLIVSPAAIANAIADAVSPFGVEVLATPLKPEIVWRLTGHRLS